jgi:hypothetical protein
MIFDVLKQIKRFNHIPHSCSHTTHPYASIFFSIFSDISCKAPHHLISCLHHIHSLHPLRLWLFPLSFFQNFPILDNQMLNFQSHCCHSHHHFGSFLRQSLAIQSQLCLGYFIQCWLEERPRLLWPFYE